MNESQRVYNRRYKRKHRWDRVRVAWFKIRRPFALVFICAMDDHKTIGHQSIIAAVSTLPSKRCRWCNRLIPK